MCFLIGVAGVRVLVSDCSAYIWAWRGHRMTGCVHAGDMLFGVSSGSIRVGFIGILKSVLKSKGGGRLVTEYYSLEADQNRAAKTI